MKSKVTRYVVSRLLKKQCSDSIPRSGDKALAVDCYSMYLKYDEDDWVLLINGIKKNGVVGKYWDGSTFSSDVCIAYEYMNGMSLEINHYYKFYDFKYKSVREWVLKDLSCYFKLIIYRDSLSQFFFNRKELALSERIYVLKALLEKTVENENFQVSEITLPNLFHGYRWILHPDKARQQRHARLILESLLGSGELERAEHGYRITGLAITTVSEYEAENTRHSESVTQSKHIKWLTLALIMVGLLQAAAKYFSSK